LDPEIKNLLIQIKGCKTEEQELKIGTRRTEKSQLIELALGLV
jgi:hypothetical protein